jgi:hypothetical protein
MLSCGAFLSLLVAVLLIAPTAEADSGTLPEPIVDAGCDWDTYECTVGTSVGGGTGSSGGPGGQGGSSSGERACSFKGVEIACSTSFGSWVALAESWCQRAEPQPPGTDSVWSGHTDGFIYACARPTRGSIPDPGQRYYTWLPDDLATPPDPAEIARDILASLQLDAPGMGMFPKGDSERHMSFVGWNVWLWSEADASNQWGPVSASRSEAGVTVTLTAEVRSVRWDMGDGGSVTCGKGTAWSSARTGGGANVASPECGYVYEVMGRYVVRAAADWDVVWSGAGQSGTIPLELVREAPMRVGEIQSVIVANN